MDTKLEESIIQVIGVQNVFMDLVRGKSKHWRHKRFNYVAKDFYYFSRNNILFSKKLMLRYEIDKPIVAVSHFFSETLFFNQGRKFKK